MAHGWTPDIHEVVMGMVITVASGTFLWLLRRVRTNDIHSLGDKIEAVSTKVDELREMNHEDHQEFFRRMRKVETAVEVLKAK